ncbi:unnamed protein product, partial [Adineta steineri]
ILDSLVYVKCVTKEILRYASIVGAMSREETRDDIPIRKEDTCVIDTQNLHRDPRYWKIDPTKFAAE